MAPADPGTDVSGAHRMRRFLGALRRSDDDVLAQTISREACESLGFAKAMFSWVDGPNWAPAHVYVPTRLDGFDGLRTAVDGTPVPLLRAPREADLVRRQQPYVLQRNEFHRDAYRPLIDLSNPAAYAAAPIVANGRTVATLHADRHTDDLDDDDVHTLLLAARLAGVVLSASENRCRLREQKARLARLVDDIFVSADRNPLGYSLFDDVVRHRPIDGTPAAPRPTSGLSARERDVLALVAAGATNLQIAGELYISQGTVKTHVRRIFGKLGVHSRAQAAAAFREFDDASGHR